jgi:hypothetical protein
MSQLPSTKPKDSTTSQQYHRLVTKPLTHGHLGDINNPNHSIPTNMLADNMLISLHSSFSALTFFLKSNVKLVKKRLCTRLSLFFVALTKCLWLDTL